MATATSSRRDLYASSDPRPKDSTKRHHGSPPKKSPTQKSCAKRPKKDMSREEISVLTYKSISLLLDAARVLDEAEKKVSKPSAPAKPKVSPLAKPAVKPAAKQPAPAKQPSPVVPVIPAPVSPPIPVPIAHDDHQYTASCSMAVSALTHLNEEPTSSVQSTSHSDESLAAQTESASAQAEPTPLINTLDPLSASELLASIVFPQPADIPMMPPAPLLSPAMPQLQPPAPIEPVVPTHHRPIAAMAIPAELRDIAVPIAHRSVSFTPRTPSMKPKAPRKPRGPNRKKGETAQERLERIAEAERKTNFGYPVECRTRIPIALRRYWERLEKEKKEAEFFSQPLRFWT